MSMYHPSHGYGIPLTHAAPADLRGDQIELILRQQPKEALVTAEGKEKTRKPVDPPPIIQLCVKQRADPSQHFLQNPYLFMCVSLYKPDKEEPYDGDGNKSLAGSVVSSLHRLKDIDNKDGGFFIFGDVSVKVSGNFRLRFSLFEYKKSSHDVAFLASITSDAFRVVMPKDFKGLEESTYLSRAFSDQGVRLRLRKEPRTMLGGNKRPYSYGESSVPNTPIAARPAMDYTGTYFDDTSSSPAKRMRGSSDVDDIDRKDIHSSYMGLPPVAAYSQAQYPVQNLKTQYSLPGQSTAPYQLSGMPTSNLSNFGFGFRSNSISSGVNNPYKMDPVPTTSGHNTLNSLPYKYEHQQSPQSQQMMGHQYGQQQPVQTPQPYHDNQQHSLHSAHTFSEDPLHSLPGLPGLDAYRTASTSSLGMNRPPHSGSMMPGTLPHLSVPDTMAGLPSQDALEEYYRPATSNTNSPKFEQRIDPQLSDIYDPKFCFNDAPHLQPDDPLDFGRLLDILPKRSTGNRSADEEICKILLDAYGQMSPKTQASYQPKLQKWRVEYYPLPEYYPSP